jgi:hypothetical protein
MRYLILTIALALTGCGITPNTPPAPSTPLAEYQLTDYETGEVEPIPKVGQVEIVMDGDQVDHFRLTPEQARILAAALEVARENTAALIERNRQIQAINAERRSLLQAGRLAETQARAYYELWVGEIHQGWLDGLMYRGVTGAMLVALAAGAL